MDIVTRLKDVRVLIVGDVMLDRFWWGDVTRVSPEAPVPVVRLNKTSLAAGGAANVAANVAGLLAKPRLVGCVGEDPEADELCGVLSQYSISPNDLIRIDSRKTTVKTRVIAHRQQVARVDQETASALRDEDSQRAFEAVSRLLPEINAVAISDYAKGFLSPDLLGRIIGAASGLGLPVIVDPKGRDYSQYQGATVLTPNRHEAALACNMEDSGKAVVRSSGQQLCSNLKDTAVLITEGEDGMTLFERENEPVHFPALAREVFDVTGAGDTVLAAIAVSLGAGLKLHDAARIANAAAGIAVEHVGTAVVDIDEVAAALASSTLQTAR